MLGSFRYNDGCVIARSADAKPFIKMGEPYFQIREKLVQHGIVAFSSNYALYGDLSQRVMTVIDSLVVNSMAYSIDEAFCDLSGMTVPLERLGRQIRSKVLRYTGIPVGVGIAGTKTLAKLANHAAKRWQRQTGGVVDITDSVRRDKLLSIRTGMFNPDEPKYARGVICELPYPTDDTRVITKAAVASLSELFQEGFKFSKAEILLMDLRQPNEFTGDLFAPSQPEASGRVMNVLDEINAKWGRGTLRTASVPVSPEWGMRRELKSPSYTTRLDELWTIGAGSSWSR